MISLNPEKGVERCGLFTVSESPLRPNPEKGVESIAIHLCGHKTTGNPEKGVESTIANIHSSTVVIKNPEKGVESSLITPYVLMAIHRNPEKGVERAHQWSPYSLALL